MRKVYATFQNKTARKVLRALAQSGDGMTSGDLAKSVGRPRSTTSECVAGLVEASLVNRSLAVDGQCLYKVGEPGRVLQLLNGFERNLLTVATDNFVELWDL